MSLQPIKKFDDLKKRVRRFLDSKTYARDEVRSLVDKLDASGEVAIFGGMLRDLSLVGNAGFKSDVDLVVKLPDLESLESVISSFQYSRNRFGGYRIRLNRWKVDLWPLQSTWAFKQGAVQGKEFSDLCSTTFFDWDAVVFNISNGKIYAIDGYVERINSGILDINLEKNPNPVANLVKAFRYAEIYGANVSGRLAGYLYCELQKISVDELSVYEKRAHDWPVLEKSFIDQMAERLAERKQDSPVCSPKFPEHRQLHF